MTPSDLLHFAHHQGMRLRRSLELTRLGFGLSGKEIEHLVDEARELDVAGLCLPPAYVLQARELLGTLPGIQLVSVANFPFGDSAPYTVEHEMRTLAHHADEIDLVAPLGHILAGNWKRLLVELEAQIQAAGGVPVKVILESASLSDLELSMAAEVAVEAGARWLKTSTGFHPAGGATAHAVKLLRSIAPSGVGVKASGGVRTREAALLMLEAGADRIGTSKGRDILGES